MRLRAIACDVMARPVYLCAARSPQVVDVTLLPRGLHAEPTDLRARLQAEIDATPAGVDAVVLGYGLCGGATAGLLARDVPLVVPRAHDCITVFLGSRERYAAETSDGPPTYWYVQDQLERASAFATGPAGVGAGADTDEALAATLARYTEQYGRDNAEYLMEVMGGWRDHYGRGAFIETATADSRATADVARDQAERRGWAFERLAGDLVLLRRLLDGDWNEDVLILQPGQRLAMSYDDGVVKAVPATG